MLNIETQQQYIIDTIMLERDSYKVDDTPSSFRNAVWFEPAAGRFLFEDSYISHEVIEPLIADGTLEYKAFEMHQGDKMLKYVLS